MQILEIHVRDSHLTGRADLGYVKLPLRSIPPDGHISSWIPVQVSIRQADPLGNGAPEDCNGQPPSN